MGFVTRWLALGFGAIAGLIVVGISGAVFEMWEVGLVLGVLVGVVVARFAVHEARRARHDADPTRAARRGSWEPR